MLTIGLVTKKKALHVLTAASARDAKATQHRRESGTVGQHSPLCPVAPGSGLTVLGQPLEASATKSGHHCELDIASQRGFFFPQTPSKKQQLPVGSAVCVREKVGKNLVNWNIKAFLCFLSKQCLTTNNFIPLALFCPGRCLNCQ